MVKYASEYLFEQANSNKNKDVFGSIIYNVKAYGAKGDGITDDTGSIQKTINAAGGETYKGVVFFPPGKYMVSSLTNYNSVSMIGEGGTSSIICSTSPTAPIVTLVSDYSGCIIRDLGFTRNVTAQPGAHGIYSTANGYKFLFSNLMVEKQYHGIFLDGNIAGAWIDKCFLENNIGDGMRIGSPNMTISNCYSSANGGNGYSFVGYGSGGLFMNKCETYINAGDGIRISPTFKISDVIINDFIGSYNGGNGIFIDTHGENIKVNNAFIEYSGSGSGLIVTAAKDGIICTANNINVDLNNNHCIWNGGHGINMQCNGFKLNGNSTIGNGQLAANVYSGMYVAGGVSEFVINANTASPYGAFPNSQAYGIILAGSNNKYEVTNNYLRGNVSGALQVGSTSTTGKMSNNSGYNPVGAGVPQPAFPANGVVYTYDFPVASMVVVSGGSITTFAKNGVTLGIANGTVIMEPGETLTFFYTGTPSWHFMGL